LSGVDRCAGVAGRQSGQITSLETIEICRWQGPFAALPAEAALRSLELGKILCFRTLSYELPESRTHLFSPSLAGGKAKNISYDAASGVLKGTEVTGSERHLLQAVMADFSETARRFVVDLFPSYAGGIEPGRTSYRPAEIAGRAYSRRQDDRLLHVDAFRSAPTRGRRILRLFCNINPMGKPRLWQIGEPFAEFAERFLPTLGRPAAPFAWLLSTIGATHGRRSAYDQLMLGLHDRAKRDILYQQSAPREEIAFPAGSTWLCFTDQVLHAAIAGQYALEQTFYLDVAAMRDPARSPLRTLERTTKRNLC
jgi:3-deoxy-D-manno-oct-2-ulosonic acid (Kdo) hydroxylase